MGATRKPRMRPNERVRWKVAGGHELEAVVDFVLPNGKVMVKGWPFSQSPDRLMHLPSVHLNCDDRIRREAVAVVDDLLDILDDALLTSESFRKDSARHRVVTAKAWADCNRR